MTRAPLGLRVGITALLDKELRSRSRGWRPMWLLLGYLIALAVAMAGFLWLSTQSNVGALAPTVGGSLFAALGAVSVVLLAFITPALTTGAISGERERRTLDLLLVTRASALGIVVGKLTSTLVHVLFLLAASLPAIVYLYCGVPVAHLALVLLIIVAVAVAHASLGLALSAVFRRSALASIMAYLVVLLLVFGLPFIAAASATGQAYNSYPASMPALPPPGSAYSYPFGYGESSPYYYYNYNSYYGSAPPGYNVARIPTQTYMGPRFFPSYAYGQSPPAYIHASPLWVVGTVLPGMWTPGAPSPYGYGANPSIGVQTTLVQGYDRNGRPQTQQMVSPWVWYIAFSVALTLVSVIVAAVALRPPPLPFMGPRRRSGARAGEATGDDFARA